MAIARIVRGPWTRKDIDAVRNLIVAELAVRTFVSCVTAALSIAKHTVVAGSVGSAATLALAHQPVVARNASRTGCPSPITMLRVVETNALAVTSDTIVAYAVTKTRLAHASRARKHTLGPVIAVLALHAWATTLRTSPIASIRACMTDAPVRVHR